ncbi:lysophospholipid acyltransferase family protein [Novosphingobium album (ex Hu et al. 2023)]|uniref:1-acyl-sn-glycerol-3-phosphate acyltransferase n=1 Tax=Novosphingobium album (ex Hu et al. 2023) TaxID=2930093 RepID=A0ABT0AX34_9SPHN|nr:lysophospholipid acyltransferase family protein [Novosphingobium album (ex Hu et al. 2023)]MCJ2177210.1 1-acyl-sn-glycerol-3-phosphate acyltransferase [Novosphingobium album (ex Hu et al. 2023)]
MPRWFLRALATIAGVRIRTRGIHPAARSFFIANHVSWLDIPALAGATGTAFVAHDGLAAIGPLRWLCELNDTVFVARHDRRSVAAQIERVRRALSETGALTVFPEGTTSDGTGLLPFKSSLLSALDTGADHIPIQPVWLDYGKVTRDIAWVGTEPGLDNALRILARWRPVNLTITFLPPLTESERANRKAMAHTARHAIASAMAEAR